jgi:hypothetical protein
VIWVWWCLVVLHLNLKFCWNIRRFIFWESWDNFVYPVLLFGVQLRVKLAESSCYAVLAARGLCLGRSHIWPFLAVGVKITTQKVPISTLTTGYVKNIPTIISIPLFIFFK